MHRWYDGRSPLPVPARVQLAADGIEIVFEDAGAAARWPYDRIEIADLRSDEVTLFLSGEDARLKISGAEFVAQVTAAVRPHRRSHGVRSAARWAAVALILVVLAGLGIGFGWPVLADRIATAVPDAWLDPIGTGAIRSLGVQGKRCEKADSLTILDALVTKLSLAAGRPKPVVLVMSNTLPNAFAVPHNRIVLLGGLLSQIEDPNELAGILAHELGHVAHRHSARIMVRQLGVFLLVELMTGGSSLGGFGATAVTLSYSREFERQADEFALNTLMAAGLDARPLGAFFERLAKKENGNLAEALTYLGTHPASADRAALFASAGGGPAMSRADFEVLKKICE